MIAGKTYTFIVEGGNDKNNSARRHPLYLSDDPDGGFDYKTDAQRQNEQIFGGVGITPDGVILPTSEGRLCEWKVNTQNPRRPEDYQNFFDFQRSLNLECAQGNSGVLRFTPDNQTPDLIYYHCYTHRNLGWKIHIVDSCDQHQLFGQSSIPKPSVLKPNPNAKSGPHDIHDKHTVPLHLDKGVESGHVFFPDLKRNGANTTGANNEKHVTYKPSVRPLIALQKPNHKYRPNSSPKPVVPQIPAPQYVPLSLPPLGGQPYHGPPPYLFSYPTPQQSYGEFPIGLSLISYKFKIY
jgi:hypothetical protein